MRSFTIHALLLSSLVGIGSTGVAYADCESDMNQLEKALSTPKLSAEAKAALDDAKVKSVAAMKKDDDAACHKAIADALSKAGMTLK